MADRAASKPQLVRVNDKAEERSDSKRSSGFLKKAFRRREKVEEKGYTRL